MTKITYLDGSGFAVVADDTILVFDCFRDPVHALRKILKENESKPVVFFLSHNKHDHLHPDIFEIAQNHERVYVLSNQIPAQDVPSSLRVAGMSPNDAIEDVYGCKRIKAFGRKDMELSFLVTTKSGVTIFHQGNLFPYGKEGKKEASNGEDIRKVQADFESELFNVKEETQEIDIVMFPVDPSVETDFAKPATEFLKAVKVKNFIPMSFGENHKEACLFSGYVPTPDTQCHCLSQVGDHVSI